MNYKLQTVSQGTQFLELTAASITADVRGPCWLVFTIIQSTDVQDASTNCTIYEKETRQQARNKKTIYENYKMEDARLRKRIYLDGQENSHELNIKLCVRVDT